MMDIPLKQQLKEQTEQSLTALKTLCPDQKIDIDAAHARIADSHYKVEVCAKELKNLHQSLILEQDKKTTVFRVGISDAKRQLSHLAINPHVSVLQANMIERTVSDIDEGSPQSIVASLLALLMSLSEDLIAFREREHIVIGKMHPHLKSGHHNILASDVAWASRRIVKSILPVIQRLATLHADHASVKSVFSQAKILDGQANVDFFHAIDLMEDAAKIMVAIQHGHHEKEVQYLHNVQNQLMSLQTSLRNQLSSSSSQSALLEEGKKHFIESVSKFKESSGKLDDPQALKTLITQNLDVMQSSVMSLVSRQQTHLRQQQRSIEDLSAQLRLATQESERLKREQIDLMKAVKDAEDSGLEDQLTQVGNRRSYEVMVSSLDQSRLNDTTVNPHGMIVLDVDHFKSINDQYGHQVGDKVIQIVANTVQSVIDKKIPSGNATLYRYGGEEFVVVVKCIGLKQLGDLACLIKRAINSRRFQCKGVGFTVGASLGASVYCKDKLLSSDVFNAADQAMYRAKKTGRNRVVLSLNKGFIDYPAVASDVPEKLIKD